MGQALGPRPRSQVAEGLAGKVIELCTEACVGRTFGELVAQTVARQPSGPAPMRDDIGDRLPMNREDHPLPGPDRVDHMARPIPQVPDTNLHVRQRSTLR